MFKEKEWNLWQFEMQISVQDAATAISPHQKPKMINLKNKTCQIILDQKYYRFVLLLHRRFVEFIFFTF